MSQPKYCANCGKDLNINANFCVFCSAPVQGGLKQPLVSETVAEVESSSSSPELPRRVSLALGIGIFLVPYIFAWFTLRNGYSSQARAISLGWAGLLVLINVFNIATNPSRPSEIRSSTSVTTANANAAELELQKAATAIVNAANTAAVPYPSQQPPNPKFMQKLDDCLSIEGELNSIRIDQEDVERILDISADFGDQAGSPKKAIYLNALKRKGELQLRRIELERKHKVCGRKR